MSEGVEKYFMWDNYILYSKDSTLLLSLSLSLSLSPLSLSLSLFFGGGTEGQARQGDFKLVTLPLHTHRTPN